MSLAIGLMSGTSCDGISAALADFKDRSYKLIAYKTFPYPKPVSDILRQSRYLSTKDIAQLNFLLGELMALACLRLIAACRIPRNRIEVIGSHGHTFYHGPYDPIPCSLQLGEPSIISHRTNITVVSDFRTKDMALGGQGAPLVPFFDWYFFRKESVRAMQNIGGIANTSILAKKNTVIAFDTGPGNCLIDFAISRISRGRLRFDDKGGLAKKGRIDKKIIAKMMKHPYFIKTPPKSTGPETFNEALISVMFGKKWALKGADAVATLTYFTALSISESYKRFVPFKVSEVIASGGGALNKTLVGHLSELLYPAKVCSISSYGIHPQAKEPVAFAFLGLRAIQGKINHLPQTTGAYKSCVLGKITPSCNKT
jgi:anhydro-N-acetylmuramic acid kinase